jgi:hypothetical protein
MWNSDSETFESCIPPGIRPTYNPAIEKKQTYSLSKKFLQLYTYTSISDYLTFNETPQELKECNIF